MVKAASIVLATVWARTARLALLKEERSFGTVVQLRTVVLQVPQPEQDVVALTVLDVLSKQGFMELISKLMVIAIFMLGFSQYRKATQVVDSQVLFIEAVLYRLGKFCL